MSEPQHEEEIKPHIILPYYIVGSSLGCTGKMYCGLILGLTSRFGVCTAKDLYFAKFLYGGDWEALSDEEKAKKTKAAKRQISHLVKEGFVSNIGTRGHRKLMLNFIENGKLEKMTVRGKNFPLESVRGKNFTFKEKKFHHLPIIYSNYIYSPTSTVETGQKSESEMLDALFDLFWEQYPRREKKKDSRRVFFGLGEKALEDLLSILPKIKQRYLNNEKKYIPLPTTFLNGNLWEDEYFQLEKSKSAKKIAKEGAVLSPVASAEAEEAVQRWRRMSLGDAGEEMLTAEDHAVMERLGMDVDAVLELIEYETLDAWRKQVYGVWDTLGIGEAV